MTTIGKNVINIFSDFPYNIYIYIEEIHIAKFKLDKVRAILLCFILFFMHLPGKNKVKI